MSGNRRTRGQKQAAKKKRRDQRARKSARSGRPAGNATLTVPIWEYPAAAQSLAEKMPSWTVDRALDYLLTKPVGWQTLEGDVTSLVPADAITDTDVSAESFVSSLEVLHELGHLGWDSMRRLHMEVLPEDDPIGN